MQHLALVALHRHFDRRWPVVLAERRADVQLAVGASHFAAVAVEQGFLAAPLGGQRFVEENPESVQNTQPLRFGLRFRVPDLFTENIGVLSQLASQRYCLLQEKAVLSAAYHRPRRDLVSFVADDRVGIEPCLFHLPPGSPYTSFSLLQSRIVLERRLFEIFQAQAPRLLRFFSGLGLRRVLERRRLRHQHTGSGSDGRGHEKGYLHGRPHLWMCVAGFCSFQFLLISWISSYFSGVSTRTSVIIPIIPAVQDARSPWVSGLEIISSITMNISWG